MLGVRCDVDIFKLTARAQSIYTEVNASMNGPTTNVSLQQERDSSGYADFPGNLFTGEHVYL